MKRSQKTSEFSVRAIQDKVVIEPERFVQLRISLNGVSETIVCPHDFDSLVRALDECSVGAEAVKIYGKCSTQMERLGLVYMNVRRSWCPTALLRKHADALVKAFTDRQLRQEDDEDE